ncbi:MAG: DNA polymerase I [Verrucomicrobiales bacterium]
MTAHAKAPDVLYLLDGMALAYRAHFAFIQRPITTSKGVNTSALFGFTSTLVELMEARNPSHLAVVFDTAAPTERHELFADYKANRQEMPDDLSQALPHLGRIAEAFGLTVLRQDGYEADDIIGTLAWQAADEGADVYMVTPDKDFGQLVRPRVTIYRPGHKGEPPQILGVDEVLGKWDIERPEQVIDMLALCGDASDNIPGVPGIGPKTAAKLLKEYHSVEELINRIDELKGKQKENFKLHTEQALLSKKLATINTAVPVPVSFADLKIGERDPAALHNLFEEFEFRSLSRRVLGGEVPKLAKQSDLFAESTVASEPLVSDRPMQTRADTCAKYILVESVKTGIEILNTFQTASEFCFHLETDGLDPLDARPLGIALCQKAGDAVFLAWPDAEDPLKQEWLNAASRLLESECALKVGHNLKFDLRVLLTAGIVVAGPFFDTMLAHALMEADARHGMDRLAESFLSYRSLPLSQLIGEKGERPLRDIPLPNLAEYAAEIADVTFQLYKVFQPKLVELGLAAVMQEIEMPLLPVLASMEQDGILLDLETLEEFSARLNNEIDQAQREVWRMAGREFSLNSPKQVGEVLFDDLQLAKKPKKTATGQYATNEQTLATLAHLHPIVPRMLDYREVVKLQNTYVEALPKSVSNITQRVHTTFGQLQTATGRLVSNNPNLQNIPIRTTLGQEIRKAFIAPPGWVLLSADYSQIELRVIAALSKDEGLQEAFLRGEDIHQATAAKIFDCSIDEVTRDQRSRAKMVNFGIPYGISPFGLAQRLACSRTEAAELIDSYFRRFPLVREFIEDVLAEARSRGWVETITGRRRWLKDINSGNGATRAAAERMAINTPIQGSAADLIKKAMSNVSCRLRQEKSEAKLLLQVHDELVLECPKDQVEILANLVKREMEQAIVLAVPVVVEIGWGENWLSAH